MRSLLPLLAAVLVGAPLLAQHDASADQAATLPTSATRPNIVLVYTDDQGWADVGCYGAEGFATPHLDRVAREGIRFTRFYVAQPVCSASRAALLTGCYPNRIGIHGALGPAAHHGLHPDETTLAEVCKARGYATAIFGKWHLGHRPEHLPLRHGFDEFYGIPYSNDMWPFHPENPKAWGDLPTMEGDAVVGLNTDQNRFTTDFTKRGCDFIERSVARGQRFFLYLAHPMPHVPLHLAAARRGTTERGLYGDVIASIDDSVGALLDTLERCGVADDTLLLFASDNGPWLSYGDHAGSVGPLREGKGTTWEGGVRVPFLARWPGHIPAGAVQDQPMMTIDVLPTIAGLLGAALPERSIDGLDCWPLLENRPDVTNPHAAYYFYYHQGDLEAVMSGRWKLHLPHRYRTLGGHAGGTGGIPVKYQQASTGLALYDLHTDPAEREDLAARRPTVVQQLLAHAEQARLELGDRLTDRVGTGSRQPGIVGQD